MLQMPQHRVDLLKEGRPLSGRLRAAISVGILSRRMIGILAEERQHVTQYDQGMARSSPLPIY